MLQDAKKFKSMKVLGTDGVCGHIRDIYFDDDKWTLRYFLLDTGKWLPGQLVLISPLAIDEIDFKNKILEVNLSREQINKSPNPSEHVPISRQMEEALADYYDYPHYWPGSGIWPAVGYDLAYYASFKNRGRQEQEFHPSNKIIKKDQHLRTVNELRGYSIEALDGRIGHIQDFILDDETWELRYLVIDTVSWWPSKIVILPPHWVTKIDWTEHKFIIKLEKDKIKNSPIYSEENLDRDYEINLYNYYQEPKYWEFEKIPNITHRRSIKSNHRKGRRSHWLY